MTIEMIQQKERLCELPPDLTDQLLADLEWLVEKLDETDVESQAYQDYLQQAKEIIDRLCEEGHSKEYIDHHRPVQLLEPAHLAA